MPVRPLRLAVPALLFFACMAPDQAGAAPRRHERIAHKHHAHHATRHATRRHEARGHRPAPRQAPEAAYAAPVMPAPSGWLITVNGNAFISPRYTGASVYTFLGYPTLSFRRAGTPLVWSSPDDSIEYHVLETSRFAIGPVIAYRGGRYATDEGAELFGIHKTEWTVEPGIFANLWVLPDQLRVRAEIRRGVRGADGFVATLGADWVAQWDALTFAIGPRVKFGDHRFMRNQFGITPADSVANPNFAVYTPNGGLYSYGAYGSVTYKQSETWSYTLDGGYDRLTRGAANSPIVTVDGAKNQWTVGATASYTFGWDGAFPWER